MRKNQATEETLEAKKIEIERLRLQLDQLRDKENGSLTTIFDLRKDKVAM